MNGQDLNNFKEWFSGYCKTFYSANEEDQKNIYLKERHTFSVCDNIVRIAKEESLNPDEIMIAEAIALFHDIGRFPQYAKHKTFNDSISVNHGLLGANILLENKIIQNLPRDEQDLIIQAVKFHNAFKLPDIRNDKVIFFLKLIRDADKLDIWRVFSEYCEKPENERASAVGLGLPNDAGYSKEVISSIHEKRIAFLSDIKTLNDLKLLLLSWVYDLNFKASFKLLYERGYINNIASKLPDGDDIKKTVESLNKFISEKINL